jgi:1,4-alpha-glucan branching enzyme
MSKEEIAMNDTRQGEFTEVIISCRAPKAKSVYVAGTFNDWDASRTPLTRSKSGDWSVTLEIPPGRYEYKFLVDGVWCCEPGCPDNSHSGCSECVPNAFGTMNRVLAVRES